MPDYDFKQLSPYDFENLSRDLLQADEGLRLESFKTGRDGGIDFRFAHGSSKSIVQCKHYATTGFAGLLRELRKEALKVIALVPDRYILVTSVALSLANKERIKLLFGDVLATSDILGRDDLNNMLGLHPAVERAHFKLWLTSRPVLDRVFHNAAVTQSEFEVEKVYEQIRRYVSSAAFPRALTILQRDHVVIISGQPGVGKTTLAKMLLYQHLEAGFEPVSMLTDFKAGRDLYQTGKKQVFYFDDFLGSTFLGDIGPSFTHNEDRVILEFLELVRRSPTARLIMTTREHILSQAIGISEKLGQSAIIDHRCVLAIEDYTFRQRAAILYNHLYFSDLPPEYRQSLIEDDFYLEVVRHEKFNPRLIEWLSTYRRVRNVTASTFRQFVRELLHDPSEIWLHAYERQISEAGRTLLLALYSLQGKAPGNMLRSAFTGLHRQRSDRYGFPTKPEDMQRAFTELSGSFIKPAGPLTDVINPSVIDLINAIIRRSPQNALDIILGAVRFEQLGRIWTFASLEGNEAIRQLLIDEVDQLMNPIARLLNAQRKIILDKGVVGYTDTRPEKRLATLIQMVNITRSEALRSLVAPYAETLMTIWKAEQVFIEDAVAIVREIRRSSWAVAKGGKTLDMRLLWIMLEHAAHHGCSSNDLRELAGLVPDDPDDDGSAHLLRDAFQDYVRNYFAGELRDCKSNDDFDGLVDELDLIAHYLDVDVSEQTTAVRPAAEEFEEHQEAYADHMQDEWRERSYDQRSDELTVRDMFGSLKRDDS